MQVSPRYNVFILIAARPAFPRQIPAPLLPAVNAAGSNLKSYGYAVKMEQ